MAGHEILNTPFFTLEYYEEKACFLRRLPPGAKDLGGGSFLLDGRTLVLPDGKNAENKILKQEYVRGKDILALARRFYNPLLESGPLMAEREDRLMELSLSGGTLTPGVSSREKKLRKKTASLSGIAEAEIVLRYGTVPRELWLPLDGLPNYRLYQNRIYEIISGEALALFSSKGKDEGAEKKLLLRGEEIPAFADDYARLIYVFADKLLYKLLAQDEVFIKPEKIKLVLYCAPFIEKSGGGIAGKASAIPALEYENKLYSAPALSRYFGRRYLPLKDRWIRRETLEQMGIGPLGRFVNGESLGPFMMKAADLLAGGGECLRRLSVAKYPGGLELDKDRWIKHGTGEEIFSGHLNFLLNWGISGGIIIGDKEKAAAFLAGWLKKKAEETGKNGPAVQEEEPELFDGSGSDRNNGRILVISSESFRERRLFRELPQSGEGPPRVPADSFTGAVSIWDPAFRGTGLGTYAELAEFTGSRAEDSGLVPPRKRRGKPWDIILAVGLDEISNLQNALQNLEALPAALRLGIFFSPGTLRGISNAGILRAFFGINGALKEFENYLIRESGDFLSLPPPSPPPPLSFLRPPDPWKTSETSEENTQDLFYAREWTIIGGSRFFVETKFQNLPLSACRLEQEEFFNSAGPETEIEFIPLGEETNYNRLSKKEKNYFLFWRDEFRRGRLHETEAAYILIYARELVLRMDAPRKAADLSPAEETFKELRRLWISYGDLYPAALGAFPRWLLDFAVLHNTTKIFDPESAFLSPGSGNGAPSRNFLSDSFISDIYLHKKYVEENNPIEFRDFIRLLRGAHKLWEKTDPAEFPYAAAEEALNTADKTLRKNYGKKLLEFFYPLPPAKERFTAFEGLTGLGHSSYTAEWISFSRHKPFIRFLSSLVVFLEYRARNADHKTGRPPYFEELWQYLCGFQDEIPRELAEPETGFPNENTAPREQSLRLETEKISRLREDSDAVMEMLKTETAGSDFYEEKKERQKTETLHFEAAPFSKLPAPLSVSRAKPGKVRQGIAAFIGTLGQTCLGCLELLSRGGGKELDAFARGNGVMAEAIIDEINEKFLNENGDLLIEYRLDEGAVIQEEYRDEVLWALTFRNA